MSQNHKFLFLPETLNQSTLRILYLRNKMYIVPSVAILVAVALFFFVVVPLVQEYFSLKEEEKNIQEKITKLKDNTSFLSGVNTAEVDNAFETSLLALPIEKDFDGILSSIDSAASDANVTLGDYSLQIGDLSSESTKVTTALPLQVNLTISAGLAGTRKFIAALATKLPLSEVAKIQVSDVSSSLALVFYYKQFPALSFDGTEKLTLFTQKQNTTIEQLSTFK